MTTFLLHSGIRPSSWAGVVLLLYLSAEAAVAQAQFSVQPDTSQQRAAVLADGQPFTTYVYATSLKKPVLYPLYAPSGTVVTRGFPLEPRPNERVDHPENVGFPTYWHARGYGLFAANPLGQKALSGGKEELNFSLQDGEEVTFRYRVAIHSGELLSNTVVRAMFDQFAQEP